MQTSDISKKWQEICEKVSTYPDVNNSQFTALLSRIQPQLIGDDFLLLTTENSFMKTWAEKNFSGVILRAVEDLYQSPFALMIEVDELANASSSKSTSFTGTSLEVNSQEVMQEEKDNTPDKFQIPNFAQYIPPSDPTDHPAVSQSLLPSTSSNQITSSFTFENFVIGDSNRLAYSTAVQVAEFPGVDQALNPLFIYGKSGLGKTHLMLAIQNYINKTRKDISTVYVDAEELLSEYTDAAAIHDKEKTSYRNFKNRYEAADVLLIDDVQYFQGKPRTLEIVFQIFKKLTDQGKQIVLSADRAPKNIDIEERYSSRFMQGGTFDIQPPEIETKIAIIKSYITECKKLKENANIKFPDDVQLFIAERSGSNIRELKGAVTIIFYHMIQNNKEEVTLAEVSKLLENHFTGMMTKNLTIDDVLSQIENYYKVKISDITGNSRSRSIVYPRQIAMYLCRQLLDIPYASIGTKFNKDHSTVMHSVEKVENMLLNSRNIQEEVEILKKLIKEM